MVCWIIVLVTFCGCAQPTGYVKRDEFSGFIYGYDDKRIGDNEFCIIATGNECSTAEHVAKLAIYHAAKVAVQNECQYFRIIKKNEKMLPRHKLQSIGILIPGAGILNIPVGEKMTLGSKSILIIRLVNEADPLASDQIDAQQVIVELDKIFNKKPSYE